MNPRPNIVIEAGFANRSAAETVVEWLDPDDTTGMVFNAGGEATPVKLSVSEGTSVLADEGGTIVQWLSTHPNVAWLQLHRPHFQPIKGAAWLLSLEESGGAWEALFDRMEQERGCRFAIASIEDSLDLVEPVSLDTLPWEYWGLIQAFERDTSGKIVKRMGLGWERLGY
ncbi:MAG: hypothetical protein RQ745_13730 [Longimicrobiales bacterium]|nr:hypothetical protein [Longimicrobiales bacterium]